MKLKIKKITRRTFRFKSIDWLKVIQILLTVIMAISLLATPLVGIIYIIS